MTLGLCDSEILAFYFFSSIFNYEPILKKKINEFKHYEDANFSLNKV